MDSQTFHTSLPEYPNFETLNCADNQITTLTNYPLLKRLNVSNNPIDAYTLSKYGRIMTLFNI